MFTGELLALPFSDLP